ncbi:VPS10 domain-containing receptor SorCS3-like [Oscarella lobularis]|uniref:VPS10 domain-containing receptor SorCS3-like n=1 Tax=Oscarella lobularis TaxID=121494 RepID=UPI003314084F
MRFLLVLLWLCLGSDAVQIASDLQLSPSTIRPIEIDRENVDEDRVRRDAASQATPSTAPTASSVTAKCANLKNDRHSLAIVHWSGQTGTQVSLMFFILTVQRNSKQISRASTLWRSTDYGDNFVDDSAKVSNAVLDYYYINGLDNKMIIFTALTAQQIYVTQDEGDSYLQVNLTFHPNLITYSPSDKNNVLGYDSIKNELHVSTDFGHTWTLIATNASNRYYWENIPGFPKDRIIFERLLGSRSKIFEASPPYNTNIKQFQAHSTPSISFDQFSMVMTNEYLISQATDSHGSGTMYTSYRRGPFIAARFPFRKSRNEKDYLLVDGSEGQLFIAVNHRSNLTSLYMSEQKGISFSLTVDDVLTNSDQNWESHHASVYMYKLAGIRGTYFVNQHKPDRSLTTIVTFDKGATWNPVSAPLTDLKGQDTNCVQPACSLQMSSRGIFSRSTAIGLVWAQGNVGSNLKASAGTFLSRDGGRTWRWVFQSYYQASFADQGAVMAAARVYRFTKTIQHSCDEGTNWKTYDVETEINVIGVLTEPGEKSLAISVFGFEHNYAEWKVCKLNFSNIIKTPCDSSQYYKWAPSDERVGRRCLLGESRVYERRKAEACCYNGRDYDRPVNVSACGCAAEDFECDFGYERNEYDSPCVPSDGTFVPGPPKNCPEETMYNITRGYRKVAGDNCANGDEDHFLYERLPCPVDPPGGLEIIGPASSLLVGQSVNFNLSQQSGGVLSTNYTWDFGDGGLIVKKHGFSAARSMSHSFSKSGSYNVKVTGVNRGGRSVSLAFVRVYDVLEKKNISINQLSSVVEKQKNAYSVVFLGDSYGDFFFAWAWGDGKTDVTKDRVAEHLYARAGFYNATVNVKSTTFLSESQTIGFYVTVNSSATVVVELQVESKKKTAIVAASVSVVSIAVFVVLALGIYYYRKKYGRLEVEYSQLRSRGKGNYVFGGNGDDDDDNTIGEEDEEESQNTAPPVVAMSALTDDN